MFVQEEVSGRGYTAGQEGQICYLKSELKNIKDDRQTDRQIAR